MDELLQSRVEQLKVIEDRLERLSHRFDQWPGVPEALEDLRSDVLLMILAAQEEHAAF